MFHGGVLHGNSFLTAHGIQISSRAMLSGSRKFKTAKVIGPMVASSTSLRRTPSWSKCSAQRSKSSRRSNADGEVVQTGAVLGEILGLVGLVTVEPDEQRDYGPGHHDAVVLSVGVWFHTLGLKAPKALTGGPSARCGEG